MRSRKAIVSLVLAFLLLCLALVPVLAAGSGTVATKADPLRVRTGPGTSHSVLYSGGKVVQLPKGSPVSILDEVPCDDGTTAYTWYEIEATFGGSVIRGYVASTYIAVAAEPDEPSGTIAEDIYDVPEAYRAYLNDLMVKHPNWTFTFYDTGLDWDYVQYNECYAGAAFRNVVSPSTNAAYRYKDKNGNYLKSEEGWYQASDQTIAYYMDPRNHMTESRIFEFELLSYNDDLQTLAGVEAAIAGTFMDGKTITAPDGRQVTYAQAILEAAQESGSSAYFLASKIIQEVGRNGSGSTSGNYTCKDGTVIKGYYNFYNIQATSATNDPVKQGLLYAQGTDADELRPWNSQYKAIVGGAKWITDGYVLEGQDTIYLQKFCVVNNDPDRLFWHQYMTNVSAAVSEANLSYNSYRNNNLLSQDFVFAIPLYDGLPAERCRLAGDTSVDPPPIPDPEPDPEPSGVQGDIDGDGKVDPTDARFALQIAVGLRTVSVALQKQADVNHDGVVDATDVRYILQAVLDLRTLS